MGLFEHFPYTNFHELNLGWFLSKFKSLLSEWATYVPIFNGIRDEAEAAAEDAAEALAAAETAQGAAETALAQANTAITTANTAVTEAQTAATAAQTARTGAETARTGAEAAQAGALAAQTAAETARTGAQNASADAVTAKNAAVAAQTAAEAAADRAEAAAEDAVIRVVYDYTDDEIDATQNPVIVSGAYSNLITQLNAGTPVKILVCSNNDDNITTPVPVRRIIQHIYPVTGVTLSTGLITIELYYWSGSSSTQPKKYTILWDSNNISILSL